MIKRYLSGCLFLLGLIPACSQTPPTGPDLQIPQIQEISSPQKAFLQDSTGIAIHARIQDPQGLADLALVKCILKRPATTELELDMFDDGKNGDILALDGQYTVHIPGFLWNDTGTGAIAIRAQDLSGNEAKSEFIDIEILPGSPGSPPQLLQATFPDTVWADSTYQILLLARVSDPDGLADIDGVRYAIFAPMQATTSISGKLLDDGQQDDGVANNGIFGAFFKSDAFGINRGIYTLLIRVVDHVGNESPAKILTFAVESHLENLPPKIISVSAPDTVSRSQEAPFVIRAVVSDPNGLGDIARVFFNSFMPNGNPSSGNPFFLRDDGKKDNNGLGDSVADDGEYALAIAVSASIPLGTYRFEFQAEDKSGLLSGIVIHKITVVE